MTLKFIENALKKENYFLRINHSILQIGPENRTLEISLKEKSKNRAESFLFNKKVNLSQESLDSAYRLKGKKGRNLTNNCVSYESNQFDEVILLANSSLEIQSSLNKAFDVLKSKGRLLFFVQNIKDKEAFCFSIEEVLPQINVRNLELESITHMQTENHNDVMCLVVSKKDN